MTPDEATEAVLTARCSLTRREIFSIMAKVREAGYRDGENHACSCERVYAAGIAYREEGTQ